MKSVLSRLIVPPNTEMPFSIVLESATSITPILAIVPPRTVPPDVFPEDVPPPMMAVVIVVSASVKIAPELTWISA